MEKVQETTLDGIVNNQPWNKKMQILQVIEGWNQQKTAEMYGSTQRQVWAWNNGLNTPQRNSRKSIAAAHKVALTEIFPAEMLKPGEV
jgi:S-formylglutathione hydrolase FrmB